MLLWFGVVFVEVVMESTFRQQHLGWHQNHPQQQQGSGMVYSNKTTHNKKNIKEQVQDKSILD